MNIWQSKLLQKISWLFQTTSTKDFGSLRYPNINEVGDEWQSARENFYRELGLDPNNVVMSGNIHGNKIAIVSSEQPKGRIDGFDGLITKEQNLILAVKTADCLPIFIIDPKNKIVGLIHSGWKGTVANIAASAVEEFKKLGSDPAELLVAIGPSIKKCHYNISDERQKEMISLKKYFSQTNGKTFVDLQAAVIDELITAGVSKNNIDNETPCTMCEPEKYFSYHSSGRFEDSLLSVITIR
ncbi:MAG: peptidoglycan editing factor PgeF [Candidatus Uhrbacteria bacterium]